MPVENAQRIGAIVAVDGHTKHEFLRSKIRRFCRLHMFGIGERRDAIFAHAAPDDLFNPDTVGNAGIEEVLKGRIDAAVGKDTEG